LELRINHQTDLQAGAALERRLPKPEIFQWRLATRSPTRTLVAGVAVDRPDFSVFVDNFCAVFGEHEFAVAPGSVQGHIILSNAS